MRHLRPDPSTRYHHNLERWTAQPKQRGPTPAPRHHGPDPALAYHLLLPDPLPQKYRRPREQASSLFYSYYFANQSSLRPSRHTPPPLCSIPPSCRPATSTIPTVALPLRQSTVQQPHSPTTSQPRAPHSASTPPRIAVLPTSLSTQQRVTSTPQPLASLPRCCRTT